MNEPKSLIVCYFALFESISVVWQGMCMSTGTDKSFCGGGPMNRLQGIKIIAFAAVFMAAASFSTANPVTWEVLNHPDGNFQNPGGEYMMILSSEWCDKCTFSVAGGGVFMSYDVMTDTHQATMSGTVQHVATDGVSENGNGGLYTISATFEMGNCSPCNTDNLTDGNGAGGDPWWGSNVADGTSGLYEDAFQDLLDNSNTPYSGGGAAASASYSEDVDRIYFDFVDMTLTHDSGSDSYDGPLVWDEAPTGGPKQFFIQDGWRGADGLAAAGWLEADSGQGDKYKFDGPSDFLFTLDNFTTTTGMPEPATTTLFALGLAAVGFTRRRKTLR